METAAMIVLNEFCIHHNVEISFINSLQQSGLIEITQADEKLYLHESQLPQLEKMVRLYYVMDINMEGIETITYLLSRINQMQQEIMQLNNKLALYTEDKLT